MKTQQRATAFAILILTLTAPMTIRAANLFWGGWGAGPALGTSWNTAGNWFTDAGETTPSGATPTMSDDLFFNTTADNALGGTVAVSANVSFLARSMTFNTSATSSFDHGNNSRTLTIGVGGITMNTGGGAVSFNGSSNALWLQAETDQSWINNTSNTLTVRRARAANSAAGPVVLTLGAAGTGNISLGAQVTDSLDTTKALGLVIDSAGTGNVSITGATYSGGTLVKRGLLSSNGQIGTSTILLGDTVGSNDARINTSGVATANIIVQANAGSGLTALTGSTGGNYQGTITMNRNLSIGSVSSSGQSIAYSGVISGAGNLTIGRVASGTDNPTVTLGNANSSYTGKTTIASATTVVSKLSNAGFNSSLGAASGANGTITMSTVSASTLRYNGTGDTTDRVIEIASSSGATLEQAGTGLLRFTGNLAQSGSGSRTLTLRGETAESSGTGEFSGLISNDVPNVSVTKTGAGTWRLSHVANTYAGTTSLTGGVLEVMKLANQGTASSIGTGTASNIAFGGGTLRYLGAGDSSNRSINVGGAGGTIDASGSGPLNFTNTGPFSVSSGTISRTFTLTGSNTGANTMATDLNDPSGSATLSITKSGGGRWVLTNSNGYTGPTTVTGGTLSLSGGTNNSASFVVNGGAHFEQSGTDWTTDLFHSAGYGSSIEIAQLADSSDNDSVIRFDLSAGTGVSAIDLTAANPFTNIAGGLTEWKNDWVIEFGLDGLNLVTEFTDLTLFTNSGGYDLTNFSGLRMVTTNGNGDLLPAAPIVNNQLIYLAKSGNLVGTYRAVFSENSVELVFQSARAIPEPSTLGLLVLALALLRRRFRA